MFERLRKKWKVNGLQLALIICTFAIGGSLTGFIGKKIMNALAIRYDWLWTIIYILLITLLWPMAVLLVSIFFGQFRFFLNYIKKIGARMGMGQSAVDSRLPIAIGTAVGSRQSAPDSLLTTQHSLKRIAIFASGAGSNAQKIIDHFKGSESQNAEISLIVCNNPGAGVLNIAAKENIPVLLIEKEKFFHGNAYAKELEEYQIDFIVLAGFLWKIPDALIKAYTNRIVNIHPALLPGLGGKGMYGNKVHEAVIASNAKESGITIHFVDGEYDNGDIIFQARCPVLPGDTPGSLADRVHQLEHEHYPKVIGELVDQLNG